MRRRRPEPDLQVHLRYAFEAGEQRGATLSNPLFELLAAVIEHGSIRQAAKALGCSYRYAWDSLRKWEQVLGEPLVLWSQGQRARPTQFAERLLWAERRARTRMQPHLEALRADLDRVITDARDPSQLLLSMRASHDIALPFLQRHVADSAALHLEITFQGSVDALRALNERQCLAAGFHVPALRAAAPIFAQALKPLLKPRVHDLIGCSRRMQGLIMRREHAGLVRTFTDVVRQGLHFVNRQPGSGTRMLVDHLLHEHSIAPGDLMGYHEHSEQTHVAVALCIASAVADVGIGIEAAALEFGLHFVPLVEENYYFVWRKENAAHPAIERLSAILGGADWRAILGRLPGYQPMDAAGRLLVIEEALPWWRSQSRSKSVSTSARR